MPNFTEIKETFYSLYTGSLYLSLKPKSKTELTAKNMRRNETP